MQYLLIDDNPIDLLVNEKVLKNIDKRIDIIKKQSGQEALTYLQKEATPPPDIILLDIKMPLMNGFQFIDALAEQQPQLIQKLVIIMVSSSIDPSDLLRAEKSEYVKAFIEKPLQKNTLQNLVSEL